jgi:hypothetical protein
MGPEKGHPPRELRSGIVGYDGLCAIRGKTHTKARRADEVIMTLKVGDGPDVVRGRLDQGLKNAGGDRQGKARKLLPRR